MSSAQEYRRLFNELLIFRAAEGGELPVDIESSYVARLDKLWWRLSVEEQDAFESELASGHTLTGPESLGLVDCEVREGGHGAPRRAA